MENIVIKRETSYLKISEDTIENNNRHEVLKNLYVISAGYRKGNIKSIGYDVRKAPGAFCLIKYCINGVGYVETKKGKIKIEKGDIFFLNHFTENRYYADSNNPWEVVWAYFYGIEAAWYIKYIEKIAGANHFHIGIDPVLTGMFLSLLDNLEKGYAIKYQLDSKAKLLKLIINIEKVHQKTNGIEQTVIYMRENIQKNIKLEKLAKVAKLSVDHYSKKFKNEYGKSPIEYFIELRMQRSCEYILTSDKSLKIIANEMGYNDYYYFSRLFKSRIGLSPKEYRKKEG